MSHPVVYRKFPLAIFAPQVILLFLAIIWAYFRGIKWYEQIQPSLLIIPALLGGATISGLSTLTVTAMIRRGHTAAKWYLNEVIMPLFYGRSWGLYLAVAIISAFCEELFFRGLLLKEVGLIASSIIFGLLHTFDRRLALCGLWAGLVGCLLGFVYQRSGNLLLPISLHFAVNLTSLLTIKYWPENYQSA